jgi:hypothetical protein
VSRTATQSKLEAGPPRAHDKLKTLKLFLWSAIAGFGTYFCMYGLREPFKVATYSQIPPLFGGVGFKTILVTSQVLGYTASKFIGIRFIAEMKPQLRATALIVLVSLAELSLVLFALIPPPWNAAVLFLNGLPLGMVFGLVMGFLEGRRQSEAMLAALCSSFVAAPGVTKTVGAWVMSRHISPFWMPSVTGIVFYLPLLGCVWMLTRIPRPTLADTQARHRREAIGSKNRWLLFGKYAPGFTLIMIGYLLLTVLRSIRGDFAAEIWDGLGVKAQAATFASSETIVAVITLLLFAALVFIKNNRIAFFAAVLMSVSGFTIGAISLLGHQQGWIKPFPFVVMVGIGLYLPYMAVHTTLFERLLAVTRDKGNIGYLMYLVDAFGYLGYVAVMLCEGSMRHGAILPLFITAAWLTMVGGMVAFLLTAVYFAVNLYRSKCGDGGPSTTGTVICGQRDSASRSVSRTS